MVNTIIKTVKLSELKPHPDNPRKISRENMDRLVKSLQEFPEMLEIKGDRMISTGDFTSLIANPAMSI